MASPSFIEEPLDFMASLSFIEEPLDFMASLSFMEEPLDFIASPVGAVVVVLEQATKLELKANPAMIAQVFQFIV
jgi:hypothetical protein